MFVVFLSSLESRRASKSLTKKITCTFDSSSCNDSLGASPLPKNFRTRSSRALVSCTTRLGSLCYHSTSDTRLNFLEMLLFWWNFSCGNKEKEVSVHSIFFLFKYYCTIHLPSSSFSFSAPGHFSAMRYFTSSPPRGSISFASFHVDLSQGQPKTWSKD